MRPRIWREIAAHDGKQPSAQSPERHKELGSQLTLLQPLKDSGAERDPDEFEHAGGIADHNGWSSASTRREDLAATAEALGLPSTTVRDWLSRYQERAPALGRALVAWAIGQGEEVGRLHADEDGRAWRRSALPGTPGAREVGVDRRGRGGC